MRQQQPYWSTTKPLANLYLSLLKLGLLTSTTNSIAPLRL